MAALDCGKREKFVQLIADGLDQSKAYREAFKSKAKPETVHAQASKIAAEHKVAIRLREIKDELAEKMLWSRVESLRKLVSVADDTEAKHGDIINAVKAINAMQGYDAPKKTELTGAEGKPVQVQAEVSAPEVAAALNGLLEKL